MYYIDNGRFPIGGCTGSCKINSVWSSTSDGSWSNLEAALVPKYISKLPTDPQASATALPGISGGPNYDYIGNWNVCGKTAGQTYELTYHLENETQKTEVNGDCPAATTQPSYYPQSSEYVVTK